MNTDHWLPKTERLNTDSLYWTADCADDADSGTENWTLETCPCFHPLSAIALARRRINTQLSTNNSQPFPPPTPGLPTGITWVLCWNAIQPWFNSGSFSMTCLIVRGLVCPITVIESPWNSFHFWNSARTATPRAFGLNRGDSTRWVSRRESGSLSNHGWTDCVFALHCWRRITCRSVSQRGRNDQS